jgi:hypothetical protein
MKPVRPDLEPVAYVLSGQQEQLFECASVAVDAASGAILAADWLGYTIRPSRAPAEAAYLAS